MTETTGGDVDPIDQIFGSKGVLAGRLKGYEFRSGQLEMAAAVWRNLAPDSRETRGRPRLLAAEAGTGTGKTLAYLVPAVLSGRRVVVSTATLNLQDQILDKEIPFIKEYIEPKLSAICIKGRQNYLCLYRWQLLAVSPQHRLFADREEVEAIGEWLADTETGDRAELEWLADDAGLWHSVSSNTSQCLGSACPEWSNCFVTRMRQKAARSRVLIVNHHLLFSDLALRRFGLGEVIPRYEAVVFDEAHHIEATATRYFGITVSNYQFLDLARDIETLAEEGLSGKNLAKTLGLAQALATRVDLWAATLPLEPGRYPLTEVINRHGSWESELAELDRQLRDVAGHLDSLVVLNEAWQGLLRRTLELRQAVQTVTACDDPGKVYWLERRSRATALTASPIEVAEELRESLYSQVAAGIFTSATLTVAGDFNYFNRRLGLPEETETVRIETPFDYRGRSRLYVPADDFPEPSNPEFSRRVQEEIFRLVSLSEGRALVLFTSTAAMRKCNEYLKERLPYPVLAQGESPRAALLERFKSEVDSVLLAVSSFWEGVDVPGEALSCLIIDKLPFEVPNDPVIKARIERIKAGGGRPFFDFQVPQAILSLRQGVGRLMRAAGDCGGLAILDVRLFSKGYGRIFRESLPPSPVTRSMDDLAAVWHPEKEL